MKIVNNDYQVTAGTEVHCELKSHTKMFSDSYNDYGAFANQNINVIDLAYPGTLPTINAYAVELALKAALALNCKINKKMHFDRKNYFYPDLPKGYQITQARSPIGVDGYVEIDIDGITKKIGIHDVHIEEDTCKSTHYMDKSFLDFNRAGVPLIEIVSEPDLKSDKEMVLYLEKLREILLYTNVSDCKIEEGSMRFDINVSVSKTDTLGTRTETKNVGSIHNAGMVVAREASRQIEELEKGNIIREETRRYDEKTERTVLMRVKETGNDYRYFPEPDIPFLVLEDDYVEKVKSNLEILPDARRKIYLEKGISVANANKIIQNRQLSDFLLGLESIDLVIASNLLLGDISAYLNRTEKNLDETMLTKEKFVELVNKLSTREITNKVFKDILVDLMESNKTTAEIISERGIETIDDEHSLSEIVCQVLAENEQSVRDYHDGHDRAIKYLMGQIMKATKGKANPSFVNQILLKKLTKQ